MSGEATQVAAPLFATRIVQQSYFFVTIALPSIAAGKLRPFLLEASGSVTRDRVLLDANLLDAVSAGAIQGHRVPRPPGFPSCARDKAEANRSGA